MQALTMSTMESTAQPRENELSPAAAVNFTLGLRNALKHGNGFFLHPRRQLLRPMSS